MKNLYSTSIIGLDAIKNNDIATVNSKFIEIYSQLVQYVSTDGIEEDELEKMCKITYLFVSKAVSIIPPGNYQENPRRGLLCRIQLIVNAKEVYKSIVIDALKKELPDFTDPLYSILCEDLFDKFEISAFALDTMFFANLKLALPEWQRLYRKYGPGIRALAKDGNLIHNKVVDYLETNWFI